MADHFTSPLNFLSVFRDLLKKLLVVDKTKRLGNLRVSGHCSTVNPNPKSTYRMPLHSFLLSWPGTTNPFERKSFKADCSPTSLPAWELAASVVFQLFVRFGADWPPQSVRFMGWGVSLHVQKRPLMYFMMAINEPRHHWGQVHLTLCGAQLSRHGSVLLMFGDCGMLGLWRATRSTPCLQSTQQWEIKTQGLRHAWIASNSEEIKRGRFSIEGGNHFAWEFWVFLWPHLWRCGPAEGVCVNTSHGQRSWSSQPCLSPRQLCPSSEVPHCPHAQLDVFREWLNGWNEAQVLFQVQCILNKSWLLPWKKNENNWILCCYFLRIIGLILPSL